MLGEPTLPLGAARMERPRNIFRITFDSVLERRVRPRQIAQRVAAEHTIVPIEAVRAGDVQVLAAGEPKNPGVPIIDLNVLADFPSVESVVASTRVRASRDLPQIKQLLLSSSVTLPDSATVKHLTGLESVFAFPAAGTGKLDLASLPAERMRNLAFSRWFATNLSALEKMAGMRRLSANLFRDALDGVARMSELRFLQVLGPAKGWAKLRECGQLEEAHLIDVQIANLRRWNTWKRLRVLVLSGRGVKSIDGLEDCENLEELTLLDMNMTELAPLRDLRRLRSLALRMVAKGADLKSVARIPNLRALTIEHAAVGDVLHLPTLKELEEAKELEEIRIMHATVDDGDLLALAGLPNLREVTLGSDIGGDVEALRAARPELKVNYTQPNPKFEALKEKVGGVTFRRPGEGLRQWSIFQSFAGAIGSHTNYSAEARIKAEIKKRDAGLAKRLDWDTEADAVGIYAEAEADIRAAAAAINSLLEAREEKSGAD
jgi:hypothetical protein